MQMALKTCLLALALGAGSAMADPADPVGQPDRGADDGTAAVAPDADIYVYPSKGQSDKQLDRDRYEGHNWAVAQSRYNPSDPHLAPHQQIRVVEMPAPGRDTATGAV